MSGFDAKSSVSDLDFDLRPHADAKGTIPEPSQEAVDQYRRSFAASFDPVLDKDGKPETPKQTQVRRRRQMVESIVTLTQSAVTAEQLGKLPHRVLVAFNNWLSRELLDPTS